MTFEALTRISLNTAIARMIIFISGSQRAAGITKMIETKATSAMISPPAAGDKGPQLNSNGLTWDPVMSTGMRARMATMWMRMSRKKRRKLMMD